MELRERKSVGIVEMWGLDSGDEGAQEGKEELKLERQKSRRVSGGGMSCGKAKAVGGNRQIASKVVGKARGSVAMSGKSDERGSDRNARLKTARRTRRQSGGNLDKYYDDGNGTEKRQLTEVGTRGMEAVVMSGEEVCAKNTEKDDTNAVQLMKTVKLEQEEFAGVEKKEERRMVWVADGRCS